jgi:hypothetical protein
VHRVTDGDAARYHDVLIASHTEHLMLEESSDVVHHHAKRPTFGGSCLTIRANDRAASLTPSL